MFHVLEGIFGGLPSDNRQARESAIDAYMGRSDLRLAVSRKRDSKASNSAGDTVRGSSTRVRKEHKIYTLNYEDWTHLPLASICVCVEEGVAKITGVGKGYFFVMQEEIIPRHYEITCAPMSVLWAYIERRQWLHPTKASRVKTSRRVGEPTHSVDRLGAIRDCTHEFEQFMSSERDVISDRIPDYRVRDQIQNSR